VADKTLVFNLDTFADKTVRRDLAARTDNRILLNFNKRSDLRFVPNRTTVKIDKFGLKNSNV
jgi:hypothetical protein